jgi:hypothetical protein
MFPHTIPKQKARLGGFAQTRETPSPCPGQQ